MPSAPDFSRLIKIEKDAPLRIRAFAATVGAPGLNLNQGGKVLDFRMLFRWMAAGCEYQDAARGRRRTDW